MDLIDRQHAIAEIYEDFMTIDMVVHNKSAQRCMDILGKLPSVSQPQDGHWIEDAETYYKALNEYGCGVDEYTPYFTDDIACSECLAKYSTIDNETQFFKFCPNCGAKMERREDD